MANTSVWFPSSSQRNSKRSATTPPVAGGSSDCSRRDSMSCPAQPTESQTNAHTDKSLIVLTVLPPGLIGQQPDGPRLTTGGRGRSLLA